MLERQAASDNQFLPACSRYYCIGGAQDAIDGSVVGGGTDSLALGSQGHGNGLMEDLICSPCLVCCLLNVNLKYS